MTTAPPALRMSGVGLTRDGIDLLDGIDWCIEPDRSWVVLGANGSGKTTLVRIASLYEHPSRGTVQVLGETLGQHRRAGTPPTGRPGERCDVAT